MLIKKQDVLNPSSGQFSEFHDSVENPIQELFSLFSRPVIEPHLVKSIAIQIQKIGEEKYLEVLKFYLRESTSSQYGG